MKESIQCSRAAALLLVLLAACRSSEPNGSVQPPDQAREGLKEFVTDDVWRQLEGGKAIAISPQELGRPQMTSQMAADLAAIVGRVGGPGIAQDLTLDREGKKIDFPSLRPCGQVLYANSLYSQFPSTLSAGELNLYGPKWLVTLCAGAEPQLSVSVAAFAVDLVPSGNVVHFPVHTGNEFYMRGIPVGWEGALPVGAESAIKLAARESGRRVNAIPELLAPNARWVPQAAQWKVKLSQEAVEKGVARGGQSLIEDEVMVGLRLDGVVSPDHPLLVVQALSEPASTQPELSSLAFRTNLHWHRDDKFTTLREVR